MEEVYTAMDGYMEGVELCKEQWNMDDMQMTILLTPIKVFGTEEGWRKLDAMNELAG